MPTPTKGPRLGGGPAHERLILANLATVALRARPHHDDRDQGQAPASARRAPDHVRQAWRPARPPPRADRRQGQGRRAHAVHRDRPGRGRAPGWLHAHHQDRPPQGRQRADGRHRARARAAQPRSRPSSRRPPRPPRRPRRRRRRPRTSPVEDAVVEDAPVEDAPVEDAARRRGVTPPTRPSSLTASVRRARPGTTASRRASASVAGRAPGSRRVPRAGAGAPRVGGMSAAGRPGARAADLPHDVAGAGRGAGARSVTARSRWTCPVTGPGSVSRSRWTRPWTRWRDAIDERRWAGARRGALPRRVRRHPRTRRGTREQVGGPGRGVLLDPPAPAAAGGVVGRCAGDRAAAGPRRPPEPVLRRPDAAGRRRRGRRCRGVRARRHERGAAGDGGRDAAGGPGADRGAGVAGQRRVRPLPRRGAAVPGARAATGGWCRAARDPPGEPGRSRHGSPGCCSRRWTRSRRGRRSRPRP